jgi:hypothetical protein
MKKDFMRRVPKSIRVGPYDFRVRLMSQKEAIGQEAFGMFSQAEGVISLQEAPTSTILAVDTLMHEISHAIFWAYHISDHDREERIVSIFGTAWAAVYRDNPGLLSWIAEGVGHV